MPPERFHNSTIGAPGYITEYAVKGEDDLEKLISMPYTPYSFESRYFEMDAELGAKSGRFILCPSAGYMEYPEPEEKYLSNLMLYLDEGLKAVTNA